MACLAQWKSLYFMNQPIFKHKSSTPPAVYQPVGVNFRPIIPQTYTPHNRTPQILVSGPQIVQNKIQNQTNFRGQQAQSYIFPNQATTVDPNRTLKLQSFGRKVSHQEQNNANTEVNQFPMARLNHSIERTLEVRQAPPQFLQSNNQNRKPLFASQMLTDQHFRADLNSKSQQSSAVKASYIFPQNEQMRPIPIKGQMRLSLNNRQRQPFRRQTNTDREKKDQTNYLNYIGNNLKYRNSPLNDPPVKNNNVTFLDSTQSSQGQSCSKKEESKQKEVSNNNLVPKNPSSINFWPLSISPYEEKKQVIPVSPFNVPQKNAQSKDKSDQHAQFKKKKPLEFLNQYKKKEKGFEYLTKTFTLNDFELLDKIGKGSFGDVYIAQQKLTGFLVVLKKLQKKKIVQLKMQEHLLREIKIQSFLKHRHLTSLYGFFSDDNYVYLILQIMPDGSLMQVKKKRKISQNQTASYIRQICQGLKYMHTQQIIHRDIKPQNIFLNNGYAKIGDFGCSIYTQSLRNTIIGSLAYISPEQLKQGSYDEKIDVWSLGVMAFQMMVGRSPYEADIIKIAKHEIAPELTELKFPQEVELSPAAKDFLINMLHLDPNARLGIAEALRHDFIRLNSKDQPQSS